MENLTRSFRETNLVLQLIQESQIKGETVMNWSSRRKKQGIFRAVYFVRRKFFKYFCFISMQSLLNTLSEYKQFCISKNITSYNFYLFLKSSKVFHVSLTATRYRGQRISIFFSKALCFTAVLSFILPLNLDMPKSQFLFFLNLVFQKSDNLTIKMRCLNPLPSNVPTIKKLVD